MLNCPKTTALLNDVLRYLQFIFQKNLLYSSTRLYFRQPIRNWYPWPTTSPKFATFGYR